MICLLVAVSGLCLWDSIHTTKTLNYMQSQSEIIYNKTLSENEITNLKTEVEDLNSYWTKKMDILSISISRKDMQPISDYLQYLASAITNNSKEDAVTYSRLLSYNIVGLKDTTKLSSLNFL